MVYAARARRRQRLRLAAVREVARAAQETIVPPLPERAGPVGIAASYESAAEAARIGGDFYEVVRIRAGLRVLIGDVEGKGLGAVGPAAAVVGAFRESAPVSARLEEVALRLSCALARRDDERLVTAVLAELTWDGRLTVLSHGHPAPLIVPERAPATEAAPVRPGVPLGLAALTDGRPGRHDGRLSPGDRVLFHTDGLTETRDRTGRLYPLTTRSALLRTGPPATALARLRTDARRHSAADHAHDDSALLLLHYPGPYRADPGDSAPAPRLATPAAPYLPADLGCDICAVPDCPLPATFTSP